MLRTIALMLSPVYSVVLMVLFLLSFVEVAVFEERRFRAKRQAAGS